MKRIIFLLLFLTQSIFAFDMDDVRDEIRLQVRDTSAATTEQHWTDTELERRIELAQNYIIRKTACIETWATTTTIVNRGEYPIASDCLEVRRVEFSTATTGKFYPLIYLSKRKLDTMDTDWKQDTGKPLYWYDVRFSTAMIGIYPRPTITYAVTRGIKYNYIKKMPDYDTYVDSSTVFDDRPFMYPYFDLIINYVARMCMIDNNDWEKAAGFKALFDEGLKQMIAELNVPTIGRTLKRD